MPLQVVGAGFGRTGTTSLEAALERLGFGPCYHMVECLPRGPEHWRRWTAAARGRSDRDAIFDGVASCVDSPACTSCAALAERFPEAKVILTVRDPERCFESTQETTFAPRSIEYPGTAEMGDFIRATINDHLQDRMHDREHLVRRLREHADEVRRTIPAPRRLEFEVRDGRAPRCSLLDRPVPDEPFPFVDDTEETKAIIARIIDEGPEAVFGPAGAS